MLVSYYWLIWFFLIAIIFFFLLFSIFNTRNLCQPLLMLVNKVKVSVCSWKVELLRLRFIFSLKGHYVQISATVTQLMEFLPKIFPKLQVHYLAADSFKDQTMAAPAFGLDFICFQDFEMVPKLYCKIPSQLVLFTYHKESLMEYQYQLFVLRIPVWRGVCKTNWQYFWIYLGKGW